MPGRDQEGLSYRNSATETLAGLVPDGKISSDEENYDTLKAVHIMLKEALAALYTDFNAFEIAKGVPKSTALYDLSRQIDGKQIAYDILAPTVEALESSLLTIDSKYKEG